MKKRVKNNNSIFSDIKEFSKNFLSIFGDSKIDEENLETMDSALAIELQNSLADIESGKALEVESIKSPKTNKVTRLHSRNKIERNESTLIDSTIERNSNIQIIQNENYDERG